MKKIGSDVLKQSKYPKTSDVIKKHKIDLVSLYEGALGGVKTAIFIDGKFAGIRWTDPKKVKEAGLSYIRGKKRTKYLREKGYVLDRETRTIKRRKRW